MLLQKMFGIFLISERKLQHIRSRRDGNISAQFVKAKFLWRKGGDKFTGITEHFHFLLL